MNEQKNLYTYPQPTLIRSAFITGSLFGRHGGSNLDRRGQFKGFRRARNFGFLHANCKRLIGLLHLLLKFDPSRFTPPRKERPPMRCSCCGAVMTIVRTRIRSASPGVVAVPTLVGVGI